MAKRIAWTAQAIADVRAIEQPIALRVLKTLARYAARINSTVWRTLQRTSGAGRALAGFPDCPLRRVRCG
jgi:plasmid stabilization system protein ParE